MLRTSSIIVALIAMFACLAATGLSQSLPNDNLRDSDSPQGVLRVEPSCRFEAGDLILYNLPENTVSINVYNVLGQHLLEQNITAHETVRVSLNFNDSGLFFVELRDENKNAIAVMKAVKR